MRKSVRLGEALKTVLCDNLMCAYVRGCSRVCVWGVAQAARRTGGRQRRSEPPFFSPPHGLRCVLDEHCEYICDLPIEPFLWEDLSKPGREGKESPDVGSLTPVGMLPELHSLTALVKTL